MSKTARLAVVAVALVIAVGAFVALRPTDDETATQSRAEVPTGKEAETPKTNTEPAPPPEPEVTRIRMRGNEVVGGATDIEATKGETVQFVVSTDKPDEVHLHGYDITKHPEPGKPARFRLTANLEGAFEIESHAAEDAGKDPLVARLVVEPS
jgi:hypothetical protein